MPDFMADVPLIICQELHFMHNGAATHFTLVARGYLNQTNPVHWIDRDGPIVWALCSPYLNPLNFYLWDNLKSLVYSSPVDDVKLTKINLWKVSKQYTTF
jgi:hypothetical protein